MKRPAIEFDLGLPPGLDPLVRWGLGLAHLEERYAYVKGRSRAGDGPGAFCENALGALGVEFAPPEARIRDLRRIEGPLLFVANHPFGGVDALILMALMARVRPDFRFMATALLEVLPELRPVLLSVEIIKRTARAGANLAPLRTAIRILANGGTLGLFPAGEVAELRSWRTRAATDRAWSPHLGTLVKRTRATVVPLYFEGQNSALFRYAGLAFPNLRIALLAREILRRNPAPVFRLGEAIRFDDREFGRDSAAIAADLRDRTLALR